MTPVAYKHVSNRRSRNIWRRSTLIPLCAAIVMLTGSGVSAAAAPTPPIHLNGQTPTQPVSPKKLTPSVAAAQLAAQTGEPQVVAEETTETSQTTANPDGTFTLIANSQPVRVEQEQGWVPIDPTLIINPDGTISPKASTIDVAFSPGGSGPFTTLEQDGSLIQMSWPQVLPAPVLDGNTATYPEILPGVDLQLTATETSYQQTLIVKDATAAANPELQTLEVAISTEGLSLVDDGDGGLDAVNTEGEQVFDGQQPIMWDSASNPKVGSEPTPTDPGGAETTELEQALTPEPGTDGHSESTLTLTPPAEELTGEQVEYPLFIDPTFAVPTPLDWGYVFTNGVTSFEGSNGGGNDLKVGYCAASACNNIGVGRSYFGFDALSLVNRPTDPTISSATLRVTQTHTYVACQSQPVELWSSNALFTSAAIWPGGMSTNLAQATSGAGDTCAATPPARVPFTGATLANHIQTQLRADNRYLNFGLKAPNEADAYQWKRFSATGVNAAPELEINYGFPPSNITAPGVLNSFTCAGKTYVTNNDVTVQGQAQNNHPVAVSSAVYFDLFRPGGTATRSNPGVGVPTGVTATFPFNDLPDGNYQYQTQARSAVADGALFGTPSPKFSFTVQTAAPTAAPTIKSDHFPSDFWGAPQGSGAIYLGTGGATNVAGYAYGWDSPANIAAPTTADCNYTKVNGTTGWLTAAGSSTGFNVPSLSVGPHTLYVRSFTAAHQMSAQTTSYKIYVPPNYGTGHMWEGENLPVTVHTMAAGNPPTTIAPGSMTYNEASTAASNGSMKHLLATGGDPTNGPEFKFTFNAGIEADYAIGAMLVKQSHFGILQFKIERPDGTSTWLNDPNTGTPYKFDGYSNGAQWVFQELGGLHLKQGPHKLVIKVVGKNPNSTPYVDTGNGTGPIQDNGYSAVLDNLIVVPINNFTTTSFNTAKNNNGIAPNGTIANIGPSGGYTSISENALKAMPGYNTTTNIFTTPAGGIQFQMPTTYAGNDNVIAMGQTIPLPGGTSTANNIEILAGAACATILKKESSLGFTLNYATTGYGPTNANLPTTPDFGATPPNPTTLDTYKTVTGTENVYNTITIAGTMPYRNMNGTQTTGGATLYRITLHNPFPDQPITAITLPNTGVNLTNDCTPSLHIFSIADPTP